MTCYDETRRPDAVPTAFNPRDYPSVVRDGMRVDEIAADPSAFIGHVRPMRHQGRNAEHDREQE
jgi:hypothetical protein